MKPITLLVLAVLIVAASPSQAADSFRQVLPAVWQIQPATAPATAPDDTRWGQINSGAGDWRWGPLVGAKPTWANAKREDVNSLWYRQTVDVPASWAGRRVIADFRRVEGDAIVFVNGKRVGELLRPGGEIDLGDAVTAGQPNALTVFVTRDYTGISRGFKADVLRYASRAGDDPIPMAHWGLGITAPVTLIARPRPVGLSDVFVKPSWRTKSLSIDVEIDAFTAVTGVTLAADVIDAAGKMVLTLHSPPFDAATGRSTHTLTASWANPIPWELNGPYLYTTRVRLDLAGKTADEYPDVKFGFREIWTDGKQIMMNGHPSRWRLSSLAEGAEFTPEGLSFLRLIGYNVVIFQDNPTAWWRDWSESPNTDDATLDNLDNVGMGASFLAPSINHLGGGLMSNLAMRDEFIREMNLYMRRYRNHPSVLALTVGMNAYNPMSAISPQGLGRRDSMTHPKAQSIAAACEIARKADPMALVYSHADGGVGDICSANIYLNFAPLQEREDWPSMWAASGNMPAMAAEFGQPFTANFWKGKRSLFTEYMAMYLGDAAYTAETDGALKTVIDSGLANTSGFGNMDKIDLANYPAYWDFQHLFVRNTDRAWRTWGVNGGWSYWVLDTGYGDPPAFRKGSNVFSRYRKIDTVLTSRPPWANPNFDIHSEANQPLLAYIAGGAVPTDKTHAYYAGETVKKSIAIVWDGPSVRKLTATWSLGDKPVGSAAVTLRPGDLQAVPVTFPVPALTARRDAALSLTVREAGKTVATDSLPLQFFPRSAPIATKARIALFDLKGVSRPMLTALGLAPLAWKPGDSLANVDVLVVGREALKPGMQALYTPEDVLRGLRVVVLEQKPEIWKGLGFKVIDTMPRYVCKRDMASPILAGVAPADLINWRGSPDLLPEAVSGSHDVQHAPKWTNRHAVASVALQIPEAYGYTPILACEFDMNYTPLLQCAYGDGRVVFSTLDFTGRVGVDPGATLLARNLFADVLTRKTTSKLVETLEPGVHYKRTPINMTADNSRPHPAYGVTVLHAAQPNIVGPIDQEVPAGYTAIVLGASKAQLDEAQLASRPASLYKASVVGYPLFDAVGPSLLRWRDHLDVSAFDPTGQPTGSAVDASGLVLSRTLGGVKRIYLQACPELLDGRYKGDADRTAAIQTSVSRLYQLVAQVVTNAGGAAERSAVARNATLDLGPSFDPLRQWQELGPFPVEKDDGATMLATKFPGEESAIAGDTNPNIDYVASNGKRLNWRQTVMGDATGHVDLPDQLGATGLAVAYFVKHVHSDRARNATLRLGMDYRIEVWANGDPVFRTVNGRPRPNSFQVNVPLNAGDNVITIKLGSGSKGFGFWADLATEAPPRDPAAAPEPEPVLYHNVGPDFDPYEFHYW